MKDFIFTHPTDLTSPNVTYRTDAVVLDGICNVLESRGLNDRDAVEVTTDLEKKLQNKFHKGTQYKVTEFVQMAQENGATLIARDPNGANAITLFEPTIAEE